MKKYTLTVTADNINLNFETKNDGFTSSELVAILEIKKQDIVDQMKRPCDFERTFIEEGKNTKIKRKKKKNG